jgi:hypothetical protein
MYSHVNQSIAASSGVAHNVIRKVTQQDHSCGTYTVLPSTKHCRRSDFFM